MSLKARAWSPPTVTRRAGTAAAQSKQLTAGRRGFCVVADRRHAVPRRRPETQGKKLSGHGGRHSETALHRFHRMKRSRTMAGTRQICRSRRCQLGDGRLFNRIQDAFDGECSGISEPHRGWKGNAFPGLPWGQVGVSARQRSPWSRGGGTLASGDSQGGRPPDRGTWSAHARDDTGDGLHLAMQAAPARRGGGSEDQKFGEGPA